MAAIQRLSHFSSMWRRLQGLLQEYFVTVCSSPANSFESLTDEKKIKLQNKRGDSHGQRLRQNTPYKTRSMFQQTHVLTHVPAYTNQALRVSGPHHHFVSEASSTQSITSTTGEQNWKVTNNTKEILHHVSFFFFPFTLPRLICLHKIPLLPSMFRRYALIA